MKNLKDKTVLVYDDGMFIELAIRLSRDFGKVYYFTNWKSEYPCSKDDRIGYGVPGIERVSEFFDYVDQADIIVFPSIYHGDLQEYLVSNGKRVWGSMRADALERDRVEAIKHFKDLGLAQPTYKKIIGIDKLREYLDDKEDKWIKVSNYRGENETWHYLDKRLSARNLDKIEQRLGDEGSIFEFLVFDPINGDDIVECGYDGFSVFGKFPKQTIMGYEKKDCAYLAKVKNYSEISPLITDFNEKIAGTLKDYGYRNFFSTEIRVGKDKVPYMIDGTLRQPSPPGELYMEMVDNLSEIIWYGAEGILIEPEFNSKFGIEIMVNSNSAENCWMDIYFPEKIRRWVKLRNLCVIDGVYSIIPRHKDFNNIGAVIAIGDTVDEVVSKARSYCQQIEGEDIECKLGDIQPLLDIIKKGEKLGIKF